MGIPKSDRNYTVWAVVIIISDHERYNSTSEDFHFTYLNENSTALLLVHPHTD